jgi:hypothetical protein
MAEHHGATSVTSEEVTHELLAMSRRVSTLWLLIFGVLALIGLVALVIFAMSGPKTASWGYPMGVLAFLLGCTHAAPIVAFLTRLAKGYWSLPIRRAAELLFISGLVTTPLFIVMVNQLPGWQNRPTIWTLWANPTGNTTWPGAPYFWDSLFMVTGHALFHGFA